jgi:hypothetical protein
MLTKCSKTFNVPPLLMMKKPTVKVKIHLRIAVTWSSKQKNPENPLSTFKKLKKKPFNKRTKEK